MDLENTPTNYRPDAVTAFTVTAVELDGPTIVFAGALASFDDVYLDGVEWSTVATAL